MRFLYVKEKDNVTDNERVILVSCKWARNDGVNSNIFVTESTDFMQI